MPKRPLEKGITEGAEPSVQSSDVEHQQVPEAKPEETPPSSLKKLVRKLTTKVTPSKAKKASPPAEHDSVDAKLAGFMSRNPQLYASAKEPAKPAALEIPEPVVRAKTLSRSQRHLQRLENPLILDPLPAEQVEALEKAKETMRQSRNARFGSRLEDYL